MAVDRFSVEYHLTTNGWVIGTSRFFGNVQGKIVDRPDNAVETWESEVYQKSAYSPEEKSWSLKWSDSQIDQATIKSLRLKYPRPN